MTTPVILFTGFLGAGKTTAINRLLQADHGRRIAAIVNDFGAINIDAELIETADDAVVGLSNGCICCTLQGDFLRTARGLLARDPAPDLIVIEASGVAEPRGVVEMVQDPMLWRALSLDAIACVLDAADLAQTEARLADPLWRAQAEQSDFLFLAKTAELGPERAAELSERLSLILRRPVLDLDAEGVPLALLEARAEPGPRQYSDRPLLRADRFETVEWQSDRPIPEAAFMAFLHRIAPDLLRAKGVLAFAERPGRPALLQLAGLRATLAPHRPHGDAPDACRLVLIWERGRLDAEAMRAELDAMA